MVAQISPDISGTKNGEKLPSGSSREDTERPQQHGQSTRVCTGMNGRNYFLENYLQNKHNAYEILDTVSVLPEI